MTLALWIGCGDDPVPGDAGDTGETLAISCGCETPCIDESITYPTRNHEDAPIDYSDPPPAGGNHNACWIQWGVHTEEVVDERWVHNLEHGGVVFLYNCPEGCAEEVAQLSELVEGYGHQGVLSPYSLMESRFAVVAWGHRMVMDCLDMAAMQSFFDSHVDQAPESLLDSPPSSCP